MISFKITSTDFIALSNGNKFNFSFKWLKIFAKASSNFWNPSSSVMVSKSLMGSSLKKELYNLVSFNFSFSPISFSKLKVIWNLLALDNNSRVRFTSGELICWFKEINAKSIDFQNWISSIILSPSDGSWFKRVMDWICRTQLLVIDVISFKNSVSSINSSGYSLPFSAINILIFGWVVINKSGIWILCCKCCNANDNSLNFFFVVANADSSFLVEMKSKYGDNPKLTANRSFSNRSLVSWFSSCGIGILIIFSCWVSGISFLSSPLDLIIITKVSKSLNPISKSERSFDILDVFSSIDLIRYKVSWLLLDINLVNTSSHCVNFGTFSLKGRKPIIQSYNWLTDNKDVTSSSIVLN